MRYYEIINELFVKPTSIRWQHEHDTDEAVTYTATLPNQMDITFTAQNQGSSPQGGIWHILFSVDSSYDRIQTDIAPTVFAAVAECLRTFMHERKPTGLLFSAYDEDPSRQKLYHVLAKKIAATLGWKIHLENVPHFNFPQKEYLVYDPKTHGSEKAL